MLDILSSKFHYYQLGKLLRLICRAWFQNIGEPSKEKFAHHYQAFDSPITRIAQFMNASMAWRRNTYTICRGSSRCQGQSRKPLYPVTERCEIWKPMRRHNIGHAGNGDTWRDDVEVFTIGWPGESYRQMAACWYCAFRRWLVREWKW